MKLSKSLCFLLATSQISAVPVANLDTVHDLVPSAEVDTPDVSLNEAGHAAALLEKRVPRTCKKVGKVILKIGTSTAINALINEAAAYAKDICEQENAPNCVKYVGYIQRGINLCFIATATVHGAIGESSRGQGEDLEPGARFKQPEYPDALAKALEESGYEYHALENVEVPQVSMQTRGVNSDGQEQEQDPSLLHRQIIRNMTYDDGTAHDIALNHFSNGDLNLHIAGDFGSLHPGDDPALTDAKPANTQLTPRKAFNGAGFKISLSTRQKSHLSKTHQNHMANAIANNWASKAARSHAGDYFGLVKTGHKANFYFRIIPEKKGFGLNYENVNSCGQMGGFL